MIHTVTSLPRQCVTTVLKFLVRLLGRHEKWTSVRIRAGANERNNKLLVFLFLFLFGLGCWEKEFSGEDEFRNSNGQRPEILHSRINPVLRDGTKPLVYLATVICASRVEEGTTMLKTALLFSRDANLYLIVFTDRGNRDELHHILEDLVAVARKLNIHVEYELHLVWMHSKSKKSWHTMFAPCSTQRLFFPLALPHISEVIYADSDALFLSNITDLWNELKRMAPYQLGAVAPEHELPGDGWYNRESLIPYYGPRGLNTGIMIMNLTAMRLFGFNEYIESISANYADVIKWADQDMLNILFHYFPAMLHPIGCEFNYRVQHCICDYPLVGDCGCKTAEESGISIFHGNRGYFHDGRAPFIMDIYNAFHDVDLTEVSATSLVAGMMDKYRRLDPESPCSNLSLALFSKFVEYNKKAWQ